MEKIFAELEIMLYLRSYSVSNHQKTNIISLTTANDVLIKIKCSTLNLLLEVAEKKPFKA